MPELAAALKAAMETGRVVLGVREARKAVQRKEARLVIIASNCPDGFLRTQQEVPVQEFPGTNQELGAACGKPYSASAAAVLDPGKSGILKR